MSERRPSRLEAAVAGFRQRLLALDGAALAALESAYSPGQESIIQLIDLLVSDIEAAGTISASDAARLARATELLRLIEAEVTRLAQAAGQVIPAAQSQAIQQALQRAEALTVAQAPDAQAAANLARQWTGLNRGALENLVGALSDGSPLNDWLNQVVGETVDEARRVLMDGITRGINPRAIGRDLARVSGMPLHRAQLTARTMTMDAYRSASLQVMAENSDILKGWTWSSAHGPRTCLACLARDDGTVYPLTVQFMGAHVACRCSPSPALLDDEDMPPIETGQEWFDRQPQDVKDRMVPVGLRDDFRAGRVTLDDMATLQRNPEFGDRWRQSTITEARANAKARRSGTPPVSPATRPVSVETPPVSAPIPATPSRPQGPFKTMAEAEDALRQIGVQDLGFRPKDVELANKVYEALAPVYDKGQPMPKGAGLPGLGAIPNRKLPGNMVAGYSVNDDVILFNPRKINVIAGDKLAAKTALNAERGWWSNDHPLHIIHHEIGHMLHYKTPNAITGGYVRPVGPDGKLLPRDAVGREIAQWQASTTQRVSRYGMTNNAEFVAEVYAGIRGGKTYDDDIMAVYRLLGGPDVDATP